MGPRAKCLTNSDLHITTNSLSYINVIFAKALLRMKFKNIFPHNLKLSLQYLVIYDLFPILITQSERMVIYIQNDLQ